MTMNKDRSAITVHLNKASPISDEPIPNLRIEATGIVTETEGENLDVVRAFYITQARDVVEAMFSTLPGGLIDAILVEFMRRKVSVLAVPYETGEAT
jgi:hypothetical protein